MSRISIIGNGNLAQNLVNTIKLNAHDIIEMYDENYESLSAFCGSKGIKIVNRLSGLDKISLSAFLSH